MSIVYQCSECGREVRPHDINYEPCYACLRRQLADTKEWLRTACARLDAYEDSSFHADLIEAAKKGKKP